MSFAGIPSLQRKCKLVWKVLRLRNLRPCCVYAPYPPFVLESEAGCCVQTQRQNCTLVIDSRFSSQLTCATALRRWVMCLFLCDIKVLLHSMCSWTWQTSAHTCPWRTLIRKVQKSLAYQKFKVKLEWRPRCHLTPVAYSFLSGLWGQLVWLLPSPLGTPILAWPVSTPGLLCFWTTHCLLPSISPLPSKGPWNHGPGAEKVRLTLALFRTHVVYS